MRYILLLLIIVSANVFAQKDKPAASDENFKIDSLPRILLRELNRFRAEKGMDRLEFVTMLNDAAYMSADKMASSGKDKVDPKQTKKNLKKVDATNRGEEITMKAPVSKGRENYKTEDVAKVIYNRWESNQKNLLVLTNPKYTLIGMSCVMD
ncbi:MAG: hypothetical protein JNM96_09015, partial [Bacteroidia bacterium]|nr:hypothetical protein [Bacteroidia bacterium]